MSLSKNAVKTSKAKIKVPWLALPDELNAFTAKQILFLVAYRKDMNATRACMAAYNVSKESAGAMAWEVSTNPSVRAAMNLFQKEFIDQYNPQQTLEELQEQVDGNKFKLRKLRKQALSKDGVEDLESETDVNPQALQALAMKVQMYNNILRQRNMEGLHSRNKIDVTNNGQGNVQVNFSMDSDIFSNASTPQPKGTA